MPPALAPTRAAFDLAAELCALPPGGTAFRSLAGGDPVTARVDWILRALAAEGLAAELDFFQPVPGTPGAVPGRPALVNILATLPGRDRSRSTLFLAHHDVVDPGSGNCQDNSASVANLVDLCGRLRREPPRHDAVVAFTDGEELGDPGICGSRRLAGRVQEGRHGPVRFAVNLELTAGGRRAILSRGGDPAALAALRRVLPDATEAATPWNDAVVLADQGIPALCLGLLDEANLAQVQARGHCDTWSLCHSRRDTFAASAVAADMDRLVSALAALA